MKNFFKNKKVFVTGHTGFKGAWLSGLLLELGAEVKGYALAPCTEPNLYDILNLQKDTRSVIADVRDGEKLASELASFKPDIILHLAAQALVRQSYSEPKETYETNIMGTVNLFEAARKAPSAKVIVNITSDKCYQNNETGQAYKESDPMGGYDPYSSSKGMAELLSAAYRNSFFNKEGISLATCRAGNVIGGGDWAADRIVPDCVRALSQNKPIVLRSPDAVRPWQFVLEPLCAYLKVAQNMWDNPAKYGSAWNIGPENTDIRTVEDLVKQLISVWGKGEYSVTPDAKMHEAKLLHLDITKAKTELPWKPVYDFDRAVTVTAEWYKNFYDKKDAAAFTANQIQTYLKEYEKFN